MSMMQSKHIIVGIFSKVWTFVGIGKVAKVWAEFMLTENSLKIALLTDDNEKERVLKGINVMSYGYFCGGLFIALL